MSEYAVSPTSLEQIFHTFAKEQTGASGDEQGVYGNEKEMELQNMFASIEEEKSDANSAFLANQPEPTNVPATGPANTPATPAWMDTVDYDVTEAEV